MFSAILQLLVDNPLLLLFTVIAIGYPLGQLRFRGSSLGVAAVLFVGLGVGALHPNLKLPDLFYQLGLVLFVYTVGLSSGPGFFASFRRKGLRDNGLVLLGLLLATGLTIALYWLLGLTPTVSAGVFAGSLTNTPALAGAIDYLKSAVSATAVDPLVAEAVVGYSVSYPMGVVGMLVVMTILQHVWKIDYAQEVQSLRQLHLGHTPISSRTLRVTQSAATEKTVQGLVVAQGWDVIFGRLKRGQTLGLVDGQTRLALGDLVTVVGTHEDLEAVTAALGEVSEEQLALDRSQLDYRRVFVSNPKIAGHRLRDLNLPQQFGAVVTRVRRGDVEFLPHGDLVLELGDRVRVLARPAQLDALGKFFGDSYKALSEVDVLTFSLGLTLGLLLGLVPVPIPGGITLRLGLAGGPLIVALLLGALGRSGPLVWHLPYSANLTLRQIGLVLFLAGVGTRSGYAFFTTLMQGGGATIFFAGVLITCLTALAILWVGYRVLRIPYGLLIGLLAGFQTQPAVLGYALAQADNDLPNIGYATVYPVATIAKILLVQVLLVVLG